ncbi:MAG: 50S ribosomal protein L32e [Thermoproteales archaeon]|nr:50S ribosomal protein L32e [Thermoproteales archaeon]
MSISEESKKEIARLLKIRTLMKMKKPRFIQMNSWYLARLGDKWKRPKGLDNKIKREKKGFPARVKIGYRKPKLVRGFHPCGMVEALVHNAKELVDLNPDIHAIRISSRVGKLKKSEIVKKAKELGFKVLNE